MEDNLLYDIASSFNQILLNGFIFKVKELNDKILQEIKCFNPEGKGYYLKIRSYQYYTNTKP